MSAPDDGGPAFPTQNGVRNDPGMTLRQYYASQCLVGEMAAWQVPVEGRESEVAERCFRIADAMIAAGKEGKP